MDGMWSVREPSRIPCGVWGEYLGMEKALG
jgi:hypothetical protein